jgi:hypothetical protein
MLHLTTQLHIALFLFSTTSLPLTTAQNTVSGSGRAERYWDCCKPDCSWVEHSPSNQPSAICDAGNNHLTDFTERSSCGGGGAYACANQSPWALNDTFSYGYAGVFLIGHAQPAWCCACYELTFDSGKLEGKRMIVQAHNSGFDLLTVNRFALAVSIKGRTGWRMYKLLISRQIPGGNTSYNGACAKQYGVPNSVFGVDGKGVQSLDDCENLPEVLQPGCRWRFGWFEDESYPTYVPNPSAPHDIP